MSIYGAEPIQIVERTDNGFRFRLQVLENIIRNNNCSQLPLVVISVNGNTRTGKSFLLNFFIRHLRHKGVEGWFQKDGDDLEGFNWQGGIDPVTSGIWIWSEPIITKDRNGRNVALLLMDTQGLFDNTMSEGDSEAMFRLSWMLSSTFVYNVKGECTGDKMQYLSRFTTMAKVNSPFSENTNEILFSLPTLVLGIRDWERDEDCSYGRHTMDTAPEGSSVNYVSWLFQEHNFKNNETIKEIRNSFESIEAYLCPHPGKIVATTKKLDSIAKADQSFLEHIQHFVENLLRPESLAPKTINGCDITGEMLLKNVNFMQSELENSSGEQKWTLTDSYISMSLTILVNSVQELKNKFSEEHLENMTIETFECEFENATKPIRKKIISFVHYLPNNQWVVKHEESYKQREDELFQSSVLFLFDKLVNKLNDKLKLEFSEDNLAVMTIDQFQIKFDDSINDNSLNINHFPQAVRSNPSVAKLNEKYEQRLNNLYHSSAKFIFVRHKKEMFKIFKNKFSETDLVKMTVNEFHKEFESVKSENGISISKYPSTVTSDGSVSDMMKKFGEKVDQLYQTSTMILFGRLVNELIEATKNEFSRSNIEYMGIDQFRDKFDRRREDNESKIKNFTSVVKIDLTKNDQWNCYNQSMDDLYQQSAHFMLHNLVDGLITQYKTTFSQQKLENLNISYFPKMLDDANLENESAINSFKRVGISDDVLIKKYKENIEEISQSSVQFMLGRLINELIAKSKIEFSVQNIQKMTMDTFQNEFNESKTDGQRDIGNLTKTVTQNPFLTQLSLSYDKNIEELYQSSAKFLFTNQIEEMIDNFNETFSEKALANMKIHEFQNKFDNTKYANELLIAKYPNVVTTDFLMINLNSKYVQRINDLYKRSAEFLLNKHVGDLNEELKSTFSKPNLAEVWIMDEFQDRYNEKKSQHNNDLEKFIDVVKSHQVNLKLPKSFSETQNRVYTSSVKFLVSKYVENMIVNLEKQFCESNIADMKIDSFETHFNKIKSENEMSISSYPQTVKSDFEVGVILSDYNRKINCLYLKSSKWILEKLVEQLHENDKIAFSDKHLVAMNIEEFRYNFNLAKERTVSSIERFPLLVRSNESVTKMLMPYNRKTNRLYDEGVKTIFRKFTDVLLNHFKDKYSGSNLKNMKKDEFHMVFEITKQENKNAIDNFIKKEVSRHLLTDLIGLYNDGVEMLYCSSLTILLGNFLDQLMVNFEEQFSECNLANLTIHEFRNQFSLSNQENERYIDSFPKYANNTSILEKRKSCNDKINQLKQSCVEFLFNEHVDKVYKNFETNFSDIDLDNLKVDEFKIMFDRAIVEHKLEIENFLKYAVVKTKSDRITNYEDKVNKLYRKCATFLFDQHVKEIIEKFKSTFTKGNLDNEKIDDFKRKFNLAKKEAEKSSQIFLDTVAIDLPVTSLLLKKSQKIEELYKVSVEYLLNKLHDTLVADLVSHMRNFSLDTFDVFVTEYNKSTRAHIESYQRQVFIFQEGELVQEYLTKLQNSFSLFLDSQLEAHIVHVADSFRNSFFGKIVGKFQLDMNIQQHIEKFETDSKEIDSRPLCLTHGNGLSEMLQRVRTAILQKSDQEREWEKVNFKQRITWLGLIAVVIITCLLILALMTDIPLRTAVGATTTILVFVALAMVVKYFIRINLQL